MHSQLAYDPRRRLTVLWDTNMQTKEWPGPNPMCQESCPGGKEARYRPQRAELKCQVPKTVLLC